MKFYTNVSRYGQMLLYRGYENGRKVSQKIKYQPTLFVNDQGGSWTALDGTKVRAVKKDSMREAKGWIQEQQRISGRKVYGNIRYIYSFINEQFFYKPFMFLFLRKERFSETCVCGAFF